MKNELLKELISSNVKCNINDIVFVTKDRLNQLIWLEKGNERAGLEHIIIRHSDDFKNAFNVEKADIPNLLETIFTNGEVISNKETFRNNQKGFDRIYYYGGNYCIMSGLGMNGFIVSAYPTKI